MNWKEKVVEIILEGELKKQRLKQTKHGRRPKTITYKRGGKKQGATTTVGKGFVPAKSGKGGTYTGKPTRRATTRPVPGMRAIVDKPHSHFDDAELGQMGDTTARERSGTHGRRGRRG